jgi:hypothetical protein
LTFGKSSSLQFVNPRDLHDSSRFFPDYVESGEEYTSTDGEVEAQSHSTPSSRKSNAQPSSPRTESENDVGADCFIAAEVLKPVLNALEEQNDDENATVPSIQSREALSHPEEDDASTIVVVVAEVLLRIVNGKF